MCVFVAAAAISIAASVAGDVVKNNAQNSAAHRNKSAALQAQMEDFAALDARGREESIAAQAKTDDINKQSERNAGYLATAAVTGGVAGNSVSAVLHQVDADKALADERVQENLNEEYAQISREKLGVAAQTQDRINRVPSANPFATGLSIVGDIASGVSANPGAFGIKS